MRASAILLLAVAAGSGGGCAFLSADYPCLDDENCPTPSTCVEGLCRPAAVTFPLLPRGAEDGDAGRSPADEPDGGQPSPDAGGSRDAGQAPTAADAGIDDIDAGADPDPDAAPDPEDAGPPALVPPTARDGIVRIDPASLEGGPLEGAPAATLELLAEGEGPLTFELVEPAHHGSVEVLASGAALYAPDDGFRGTDRFVWSVSSAGGTAEARVFVEVVATPPARGVLLDLAPLEAPVDAPLDASLDAPRLVEVPATLLSLDDDALAGLSVRDAATGEPVAWSGDEAGAGGASFIWLRASPEAVRLELAADGLLVGHDPGAVFAEYESVWHLASGDDALGRLPGSVVGASAAEGMCGAALAFSGTASSVDLGTDLDLLRAAPSATVSAWVAPSGPTASRGVVFAAAVGGGGDAGASRIQVEMQGDRRLEVLARAEDGSSPWRLETVDPVLTLGAFAHVTVTAGFGADRLRLFVDGERQDLRTVSTGGQPGGPAPPPTTGFTGSATSNTPAQAAAIGSQDDGSGEHFVGVLDEVRVAELELDDEEVRAHYLGARPAVAEGGPTATLLTAGSGSGDVVTLDEAAPSGAVLLAFVAGEGAGAAEVRGLGVVWVPVSLCDDDAALATPGRAFWAGGALAAPGAVVVERTGGEGALSAVVVEVDRAVGLAPMGAAALGPLACGGLAASFEGGTSRSVSVEMLAPDAASMLEDEAQVPVSILTTLPGLVVVARSISADAGPVTPLGAPGGEGLAVGIR